MTMDVWRTFIVFKNELLVFYFKQKRKEKAVNKSNKRIDTLAENFCTMQKMFILT